MPGSAWPTACHNNPIAEAYETCVKQAAESLQHHVILVAKDPAYPMPPNYSIQTETFPVP